MTRTTGTIRVPRTTDRRLLPHDRAQAVPGERATAIRNVPGTLALFATHFPRFPVLPGVLILDDITETARLAAGGGPGWTLAEAQRVRFRHFVEPGDRMEITVEVVAASESALTAKAVVRVDGRNVTTVRRLRLERTVAGADREAAPAQQPEARGAGQADEVERAGRAERADEVERAGRAEWADAAHRSETALQASTAHGAEGAHRRRTQA